MLLYFTEKIIKQLAEKIPNLRIDADFRNTTVQGKVKDAEVMKIPYIIVLGDREEKENTLAIRAKSNKKIQTFEVNDFIEDLKKEINEKK